MSLFVYFLAVLGAIQLLALLAVAGFVVAFYVTGWCARRRDGRAVVAEFERVLAICEEVRLSYPPLPAGFLAERVSDRCAEQFDMGLEP